MYSPFNQPLNKSSIDKIKDIYEQLKNYYNNEEFKVTFNKDGGAGSKTILIKKNGGLVSDFYFYPRKIDGKIDSIAIYGQHLDGHLRTIGNSKLIFNLPVKSIELITSGTESPFVDIFIDNYKDYEDFITNNNNF